MAAIVAILSAIAGVAVVYQLTKNVASSGQTPVTGLGTATTGLTSVTSTLFK